MAQVELIMPKMGESIIEATILRWVKNVGERVAMDESILEIATDKVDSEVPSPVAGTLTEIRFKENDVVPIGTVIAIISTENESPVKDSPSVATAAISTAPIASTTSAISEQHSTAATEEDSDRFYSPLVRNIAKQEGISNAELEKITGSGAQGRVTKQDILNYVANRKNAPTSSMPAAAPAPVSAPAPQPTNTPPQTAAISVSGNVEIIEMDRMRKLIADHMVMSKHTSPHVTSFVEADVTNLVNWRNKVKGEFSKKFGENITFTPIFIEAVAKAIRDFSMINASIDGTRIIIRKDVNIGMAAALPSGNLIVPVIKGADQLNLAGLTKQVNDLASRARQNQLKPDEIQGGTFTLTNVGTFGNVMGTPIINQPQVAILATGAIKKKPAVIETEFGDVIAIRQMMFLSLSYDHRVVDGSLGGSFLRRVADYLEQFDANRKV
jgi:2-oxoglutarate dehydrogenase E2 component (dihydrolipoamide succinyltransferase)